MKTLFHVLSTWAIAALALTASAANTLTVTPSTSVYSATASSLTVTVNLTYASSLSALDFTATTPAASGAWKVPTVTGANVPQNVPGTDDLGSGGLGFVYSSIPANSASFTFTLTYPAGMSGNKVVNYVANFTDEGTSAVSTITGSFTLAPALTAVKAIPTKTLTAGNEVTSFIPVTGANGALPYTFAIGAASPALPTGLSLNTSTGAITGTPTGTSVSTAYTITITDAASGSASNTFDLTVNAAPTSILAIASRALTINTLAAPFTPVTATGGTAPLTFSVSPALPTGLAISSSTGAITGTPTITAAATNYTVTATDAAGAVTSKVFNLVVNGAPVATQAVPTKVLSAGTAAVAFTPVTASGGTAPYLYAVSPALPATLSLNSGTGSITGTAGALTGNATYTVTITDSVGATAANTFDLAVNDAVSTTLAIPSRSLTAGTTATAFTPVTAAGGTPPYTFTVLPALSSGLTLDPATGTISGTPAAGVVATNYAITATDSVGSASSKTFSLTINVGFTSSVAVPSRALTVNTLASSFTPVTVAGGTSPFLFAIDPALPAGLLLNSSTGVITGTPTTTQTATPHTVTITDGVGAVTSKAFSLTVNSAVVATQNVASRTLTAGSAAAAFTPVLASGGTAPLGYSILPVLPSGLTLDFVTGAISGTPAAGLTATVFTVTATDAAGATAAQTFTLDINGPIAANLDLPSKAITAGTVASFKPVSGGGGTAPYTYSISPALPSGLSLDSGTGVISGTAAAAATAANFTVTVTDTTSATASRAFSLSVNAALTATQVVATKALSAGTPAASFIPVTGAAGTPPYVYTATLPANLAINAASGAITGTPTTAAGTTPITVTVTDSVGASASNSFSLTVNVALAANTGTIASRTLTAGALAAPFTPLPLTGGTPPYSWSVSPGLPPGLTLAPTTGAITGTPSAALAGNFTITGSDSVGAQVTQSLSLLVNAGLTATQAIASRTLSAGTPAIPFAPVTAAGGTAPLEFSIAPTLPSAMALDPATGVISGTPAAALPATTFTVTVTDAVGATANRTFSLTVNGPLTATQAVASRTLTATTPAAPFTPVTGAGGTAPYTFSVSPALPAGLTISPTTGNVTGAAAAALGATTFTVTITDSVAATASSAFSLTVNPALATTPAVPSRVLSAGAAAATFTPVTAADGTPPYVFSVSPALPASLTLAAATGAISGTPNAALTATTFTVTATDSVNAVSSKTFSLTVNASPTVNAALAVSSKALTAGTAAVPFVPLPVTGGTPPYSYSVTPALPAGLGLDPNTGQITGTPAAATASAVYTIKATDSVGAFASLPLTLVINPAPVATQAIASRTLTVGAAAPAFRPVFPTGGTAPFTFAVTPALPGALTLNASTGNISGTPAATSGATTYTITVTDGAGATASNTFSLTVNAAVSATQAIATKVLTAGAAATAFTPVTASGGTPGYSFAISPALPPGLGISASNGAISGTPAAAATATTYTITVTDNSAGTASATFSLTVNTALTSTQAVASKVLTINTAATAFTPVTIAGGTPAFTYAVSPALPAGLVLDPATGAVSGTPTAASAATTYTVTITDLLGATTGKTFSLTVNSAIVATQAAASRTFTVGAVAPAFRPVTATGGTAPYSYAVAPALPAGLLLSASTGEVSGTPTVAATATTHTVTVTDAVGATATQAFSLTVNGAVTATQAIASRVLTAGTAAATFTPVTASGGTAPYGFSIAPTLPGGLTLNPTTGAIAGTPIAAQPATTFTVTVTDLSGATASRTFSLTVNGAVVATPTLANKVLSAGTPAVAFTPVTGTAGTPPYAFAVAPALPAGLSLSPTTGAISGTPAAAAGAAPYTVTITDSLGSTASATFGLTVNAALAADTGTIASRTLTAGAVSAPFLPLPLTGGTPPYVWSVAPALPAGLVLSASTGAITGTPAAALVSTNFTITGTDGVGAQVTQVLALTVNGTLTTAQAVAASTLTAGSPATAFTPVTAAGGTAPYSFAIAPTLPAGLTINPATGSVSGTPGVALSATTFTVTATDAAGAVSSKTFSLTVSGPLDATLVNPTKSLTATTAAVAFAPVVGAGGTAPYTYAISPALPAALVMSTTTGTITGTPAAVLAATPFTITVTDNATATASNTFSLTVNPSLTMTQAIASKILSSGAPATPFVPVTAADGSPPYTYAISPALPAALTLNPASGSISGAPIAALAATTFTVTATDAAGATSNKTFSLTVNGAPTPLAGQTVSFKALTAGRAAVDFAPLPLTGGTPPFLYAVSPALPTGLSLDPNTGVISGTPAGAATPALYAITATDSVGAFVSLGLTLVVNPAPVATPAVPATVLLFNVAAPPFTPVTVAGGTPPFTFAVAPALPAGLTMAADTGAVSGTPTATSGIVTHTVTATDAAGATANATFTLKVNRAPAITAPPTASAFYVVGGNLTLNVVAAGSPAPTYQWRKGGTDITGNASATTASLSITGLQLSDAGSYDVVVTNEAGTLTSTPVNVVVYQAPAITTHPVAQTIRAGQDTTAFTVVATGVPTPTYQWRRNGAPLSGATSSTLTLTNVPSNGGGAITVVVTNPGGSVTSNAATLTVNPLAPVFAANLPTTATAVKDRNFFFPVAINNTAATFTATGLAGPGGTLAVNASNGSLTGTPANIGTFAITITATNSISESASFTLNLTVQAPPPVITSPASASGRVGTAFSFTVVGTNSPTNYAASGLPAGLSIDAGTGVISGTPTAAGTFTVGLTVTNATAPITQPLVISIAPPLNAPVYTGTLTPSGTQGATFNFTPAFGTVTAPYALTGTLPTGLTFNSTTGVISGTPTQTGSFPVTLSATNAGGTTAASLSVVINPAPSAPVITSASVLPGARVGTAFSFTLTSTGTPAASGYSATGLPAGLTLNASTGVISGTPTAFGTFSVTVSATNSVGTGQTAILSISVAPSLSAPVITSAPVAAGKVNQAFSYNLTASNSPTSYQITSGTLPAGLSLNAATGAITGTPTAAALGQTRVWFNATDSVGVGFGPISGLSLEVLFTIAPPDSTPIITSNGTATAQVGQPFQYAITASSGTAISGYGATGRPSWLALDAATGLLSGIPTEATTTAISVALTATNTGGTGNPKTLLITVLPAPATPIITSPLSAVGQVGTAFTYQISGSESPTSFVAAGLPAGLLLDSATGAITGTPTVSNTYAVTLRAANVGGLGAASTLNIVISPAAAAPAITSAASKAGQVGVAFSYQIVATNGPILSYAIAGTLPSGLSLNTSTGLITGTPADDPRLYTVQLTATNAGGTSLPQPLNIALAPALGVPVLTTPLYTTGTVGDSFSFTITATNLTGSAPYAPPILLEAFDLPAGLANNPATGVIQGVPTTVGTSVATLRATNAAGTGPWRDLSVTILPAPTAPVVNVTGAAVGQSGQPFNYQIVASNSPTSYEVLGAPAWLTLNSATGAITGTPTAPGEVRVQLVATNSAGTSIPVPLDLSILAAAGTPVVTSSRTQSGTVGTAMTFTIVVDPTSPAPTFVATGMPGGLSLNPSTGVVTGTPNVSGTYNVIVTPSNSNGVGAPVKIVVTIAPNVTFN